MKVLSLLVAVAGLVSLLLALFGRFFGPSIVFLFGDSFASATLLQVSAVMFSMAAFLRLLSMKP